jgi:hypothetical protein
MMQTNGPVRDYARYVVASSSKFLRPQSIGESTDAAQYIYRKYFTRLISITIAPSLYISGFLTVLFYLVFPRLFETSYVGNRTYQIIEFCVFLTLGLTVGIAVAGLGLAKIATFANEIVKATLVSEDLTTEEIAKRSKGRLLATYRTVLRVTWYQSGFLLISVTPLILGGFLTNITSETNVIAGVAALISMITIPIGVIFAMARLGVSMCSVATCAEEQTKPKDTIKRGKKLYVNQAYGRQAGNPAVNASVSMALIYVFLRVGLFIVDNTLGIKQSILEFVQVPLLRIFVDTAMTLLPEVVTVTLVIPYLTIASSMHYYQRRISQEGLDIETLFSKLPANRR